MSLSSRLRPLAAASLVLALAGLTGACSFTPVYSGALAASPTIDIAYARPATRLEQVVYQELALRLGSSASAMAPLAAVTVSTSTASISSMTASPGPNSAARVTATTTLTLTQRGPNPAEPVTITRRASADYTTNGQVLADTTAASEAAERAARASAESLRLAILASLSR